MSLRGLRILALLALVDCGTTTSSGADAGLPAGQCRVSADCAAMGGGYFCGARVLPPMCSGQCEASGGATCLNDGDCADAGAGTICSALSSLGPCFCVRGGAQPQPRCAKGCSSAVDCGPGLTCNPTHRCVAAPCAQPSECGSGDFTCTSSLCVAKPCTKDGDCANFCVTGSCSAVIGSCAQALP